MGPSQIAIPPFEAYVIPSLRLSREKLNRLCTKGLGVYFSDFVTFHCPFQIPFKQTSKSYFFSALAPTPGFGWFFPFLALSIFLSKFLFKKHQNHTFFPALAPKINLVL